MWLDVVLGVLAPLGVGAVVGAGVRRGLAATRRGVLLAAGWCEAGVGLAWAVVGTAAVLGGVSPAAVPVLFVVSVVGVAGVATDLAVGRLPDAVTLPAVPVGWAALVPLGGSAVLAGVAGTLVLGGVHALVGVLAPGSTGGGDVKLAAALGGPLAAAGWWTVALVPVAAAVLLVAAAAVLRRRALPLGPPLLGVSWIVLLASA
ncbi:prepilin peptidase [Actinomycetospora termitidis]|uniref:Prepilin peptidase n=1 Tax=Actinomycetospora termitidis TaxID=3053470 RepID=A0ABT7MBD4_9PSEU|nr:prepilin peptidase [Actinomycetospora sp. Odt1-22]MDL5157972.1 prepilin peptidase [Actinomycetospora sp. Odt1-22]